MPLVNLPDGNQAQFPDTMSADQIGEVLRKQFPPSAPATAAPAPAAPRPDEGYSNEGKTHPELTEGAGTKVTRLLNEGGAPALGNFVKDAAIGVGRVAATTGKTASTVFPTLRMLKEIGQARGVDPIGDVDKGTAKMYEDAGPGATAGKIAAEIALTGPASGAAGKAVADKVVGPAATVLRKALSRGVEGATSGAVAGGSLAPGEGETRLGNAAQAAAAGSVAAPVVGAAGDGIKYLKKALAPGVRGALTRANDMFDEVLGKGRKDAVTNNLDIPRTLPMSTAAAAGRPELDAMERISRRSANPVDNARWAGLDARTNAAANSKLQNALGDDIASLQPRAAEAEDTLKEAQNALNKIKMGNPERQALSDELISLKSRPEFENSKARTLLNNLAGDFLDPNAQKTVGGLAHLETDIMQDASLSGPTKKAIWDVVRKHIDANGGGSWSEAYAIRQEALDALKQSQAANNIANDFNSAYGGARGKTAPSGEAAVGSKRLENSVNKWGETRPKDGADPENLLNPQTRDELHTLVDALRKAESPRVGSGGHVSGSTAWGAFDRTGNPTPVNSSLVNAAKIVLRKVTNDRAGGTARAADLALRSPAGWQRMLDAAEKTKEISASDAAMIARILRGTGAAAGSLSTGE